ncbi:endo alpha-1,4 polygalactosaminidase [Deinococcus sonorensis]|uniref:Endo alpha-1,4 polygalactosaminidase n=2 Tax=Deinococcus sonorensis TaxID=309891 RepID=A0AAU7U4Q1_9DEIO
MRHLYFGGLALTVVLAACSQPTVPASDAASAAPAVQAQTLPPIKLPPRGKVGWDWQIGASSSSSIAVPAGVTVMDLDGFTVSATKVAALKQQGIYTVCYMDMGSYEPWRPDSSRYPNSIKIQQDPDWPDEYFLDVTNVFKSPSVLAPILIDRMKLCKSKGFDALEPDNLQNDENVSGGRITRQQQLDFNGWIADRAHENGLAVLQKNGPDQILQRDRTGKMMVEKFDGILNEQCQEYGECSALGEYTRRGKLALDAEYRRTALNCSMMSASGINAIRKDLDLVGKNMSGYVRIGCP